MTTHTNHNQTAALRRIANGESVEQIHPATLRALVNKKLVRRQGTTWTLLPDGITLLAQSVPYNLQMLHDGKWIPVRDASGQPAVYSTVDEAERAAATCSMINSVQVRLMPVDTPESETFTLYDFGRRYMSSADGGKLLMPRVIPPTDHAEESAFYLYVVQRRSRHWANAGMFAPWGLANATRFVDLDEAIAAARKAAAADTTAFEYRVKLENAPELSPTVYVQSEQLPDLGVLDTLASMINAQGVTEKERRANALGMLVSAWAIGQAELVIAAVRACLLDTANNTDMSLDTLLQKLA